jgi:endonuclease-8
LEGPSLIILREELEPFRGQKVLNVKGNTKQPKHLVKGCTLSKIDTWGKVLFLVFTAPKSPQIIVKTHFLLFGSYRINEPKADRDPRLELKFKNGILYFYACSIQFDAENYYSELDRKVDVLSPFWDEKHVLGLLEKKSRAFLCDLLLDQSLFAGSGNIVKNEVLFNIRRHPLTKLSDIKKEDWPRLVHAVREYCENFYTWKKNFELRRHWQVYRRSVCPICKTKLIRENLGKFQRRTFYCPKHQLLKRDTKRMRVLPVLPITNSMPRESTFDH